MTQVTQEKYNLVKQLLKTPLNNVEVGEYVKLHSSTIGRIKKSESLEDYKEMRRVSHESHYPYPLNEEIRAIPAQVELGLESTPTVIGELTRIANALDHIVEVLER